MFPAEKHIDRASSSLGSRKAFEYHTDQAYNRDPEMVPNTVMLSCIRNNEKSATTYATLEDIISDLTTEELNILRLNEFEFCLGRPEEGKGSRLGPVIDKQGIRLGTDMLTHGEHADAVLKRVRELAAKHAVEVILEPGQTLVIPNRQTVHARTGFEPSIDPTSRRWLQRVDIW